MSYVDNTIADAIARYRPNHAGWIRVQCPICPERKGSRDRGTSLAIKPATGEVMCWRCGFETRVDRNGATGASEFTPSDSKNDAPEIGLPDGFTELASENGRTARVLRPAREMLIRRRVPEALWGPLGAGACLDSWYRYKGLDGEERVLRVRRCVVLPIRSDGRLKGWVARTWTKVSPKYKNCPGLQRGQLLYNQSCLAEATSEPALVVEGVFDAIPYWPNATACLGKPTENQVRIMLQTKRPIVVCLDGDAHEEGEMLALRLRFEGIRAGFVRLPPCEDPGSVDPGWLRDEAIRSIS